jgi:hypothetical protein
MSSHGSISLSAAEVNANPTKYRLVLAASPFRRSVSTFGGPGDQGEAIGADQGEATSPDPGDWAEGTPGHHPDQAAPLAKLGAALAKLSPADRARLVAMLTAHRNESEGNPG